MYRNVLNENKKDKPNTKCTSCHDHHCTIIPAATPLLNEGTELIIVALLGEANIPIPTPTSTSGNTNSYIDVVGPISDNIKKPIS